MFEFTGRPYTFDRYGLTKEGEPISVDMYCLQLASLDFTHVILHQDKDEHGSIRENDIDLKQSFNELAPLLLPDQNTPEEERSLQQARL